MIHRYNETKEAMLEHKAAEVGWNAGGGDSKDMNQLIILKLNSFIATKE